MKRTIVRFGSAIAIGVLILIIYSRKSATQPSPTETIRPITIPSGEMLTLGTPQGSVTMKNFYTDAVNIARGDVIIRQADTYAIDYFQSTNTFTIALFVQDPTARTAAEADFLSLLQINQQDACRLYVLVQAPQGGGASRLSFCGTQ